MERFEKNSTVGSFCATRLWTDVFCDKRNIMDLLAFIFSFSTPISEVVLNTLATCFAILNDMRTVIFTVIKK